MRSDSQFGKFAAVVNNVDFKTIYDMKGSAFVVLGESCAGKDVSSVEITDKTAFEAVENHIHISLKKTGFIKLFSLRREGITLCRRFMLLLKEKYPTRDFVVYVTVTLGDAAILRFHQKWNGEADYYSDAAPYKNTVLIKLTSVGNDNTVRIMDGTVFGRIKYRFRRPIR